MDQLPPVPPKRARRELPPIVTLNLAPHASKYCHMRRFFSLFDPSYENTLVTNHFLARCVWSAMGAGRSHKRFLRR